MLDNKWWLLGLLALLTACAQVAGLEGGDKDVTAPKIINAAPSIGQTNFKGNKITLTFDEYVQVRDLAKNLITSPPFTQVPKYLLKGKSLVIILPDSLIDNTTYYLNFGKAIVDLNEGNVLDSNLMVFSTGNYIDSIRYSGQVKNAETLAPMADVFVMLYPQLEDSVPSKIRPTYFAKTNSSGQFTLEFVKPGRYQLFALLDKNANYKFDLPTEGIAFLPEPISLDYTTPDSSDSSAILTQMPISLMLFTEDNQKQFVKGLTEIQTGQLQLTFNLPVDTLNLELQGLYGKSLTQWQTIWSPSLDTLNLWNADAMMGDTFNLSVKLNDKTDTLKVLFAKARPEKEKEKKKVKGHLALRSNVASRQFKWSDTLFVTSEAPILKVDTACIQLLNTKDSLAVAYEVISTSSPLKWAIKAPFEAGVNYALQLDSGAFTSIFGLSNDSLQLNFKPLGEQDFGYLNLTIVDSTSTENLKVWLIDEKQQPIKSWNAERGRAYALEYLKPGNYGLKLLFDTDANGAFTPGKYGAKRQAEQVLFYEGNISIEANWEIDLEWNLSQVKRNEH